jgi:lipopolysaccharide transport system ATP-binding protein
MRDVVVSAGRLGKQYSLGAGAPYQTLRERMNGLFKAPARLLRRRAGRKNRPCESSFWALKDVSFDIKRGEVVGIIGRNGAGKSTLLKILSRITEPTEGEADLHGRVGSLLEVGTGFHHELTGRENIFLNGAILGMRRAEIDRKFDEIVAFAEVDKFIDTPVKHYSSGMYMRLAFAVAAHLEPEILMVDEVLAVGDASFQQKCLNKMGDSARGGRTILFVSHNLSAVRTLCSRVCVLKQGMLVFDGPVNDGLAYYSVEQERISNCWLRPTELSCDKLAFTEIAAELKGRQPTHTLMVEMRLREAARYLPAFVALDITDEIGSVLMQALPCCDAFLHPNGQGHVVRVTVELPPLIPGTYAVTAWVGPHNTHTYDLVESAVRFVIDESPTENRTFPHSRQHGALVPRSQMEHHSL